MDELRLLQGVFKTGHGKLEAIAGYIEKVRKENSLDFLVDGIDEKKGELTFWFAGTQYYTKIRLTDRDVEDVGPEYRAPMGWLDWGRCNRFGRMEPPEQSNFYDEKGILCELDGKEYFCNMQTSANEQIMTVLLNTLSKLIRKTIAVNNVESV